MLKNFTKNSTKLLRSPCPIMLQKFITKGALKGHLGTQRALKEQTKSTSALGGHSKGTPRALGHSRHSSTGTLKGHLDTRGHSRQSGTRALEALEHLKGPRALGHSRSKSTQVLEGQWGAQTLRNLGTQGTSRTLFSKFNISTSILYNDCPSL